MQARHVQPLRVGGHNLGDYTVETHGRGVDDPRTVRTVLQHFLRDQGPGVKADRRGCNQIPTPQRKKVGRAGACADEVNGHGSGLSD